MSMEDYNFAKAREAWATPVKIVQYNCTCGKTMKFESEHGVIAPQRTEQNFCPRCGKRTNDIHTCTPPKHTEQEPVGFAGIEMWIGNTRIKKLMTQTELHFAIDPWAIVKFNSDSCIDALKEKNT